MSSKGISAGELNCRLLLHREIKTYDGQGGYAVSYSSSPYATVYSKFEMIVARRMIEYEQAIPEVHHRITIRYRPDVAYSDQPRIGTRVFEQYAPPVNVGEKNMFLQLLCREVIPDES